MKRPVKWTPFVSVNKNDGTWVICNLKLLVTEFNTIFSDLQPGQLPDKKSRDNIWNDGLITIQPPDMAVGLKIFY